MRLGVVGMLPPDFREISDQHLAAIKALNLTGTAFHAPGENLAAITTAECHKVRDTIAAAGMELPQFGIGFSECLFDPDSAVRDQVVGKIERGIEVARDLAAHTCLIRTGSRNPVGSYSPSPLNLTPEARALLVETLKRVAAKAESEAVTIVIETHLLTIMGSPEINRDVLQAVGSERMTVVMDYVNHFQNLDQVYNSTERLQHIFEIMNPISVRRALQGYQAVPWLGAPHRRGNTRRRRTRPQPPRSSCGTTPIPTATCSSNTCPTRNTPEPPPMSTASSPKPAFPYIKRPSNQGEYCD